MLPRPATIPEIKLVRGDVSVFGTMIEKPSNVPPLVLAENTKYARPLRDPLITQSQIPTGELPWAWPLPAGPSNSRAAKMGRTARPKLVGLVTPCAPQMLKTGPKSAVFTARTE